MRHDGCRYERIDATLRAANELIASGVPIRELHDYLGISRATYYRWKQQYDRLGIEDMKRMHELEQENANLRKTIAELKTEMKVLKEVALGKWQAR